MEPTREQMPQDLYRYCRSIRFHRRSIAPIKKGEKEISTLRLSHSLKLPARPENPCTYFDFGFWGAGTTAPARLLMPIEANIKYTLHVISESFSASLHHISG
jgi:hypothetical protein